MSISSMIQQAQASLPAASFNRDMSNLVDMRDQVPESAFSGVMDGMMGGQIDNTMADMQNFPGDADQFHLNGMQSMAGGVAALAGGGMLAKLAPTVLDSMGGFGDKLTEQLGFDPKAAAKDPSILNDAQARLGADGSNPNMGDQKSSDAQANAQMATDTARQGASGVKNASKFVPEGTDINAVARGTEAVEKAAGAGAEEVGKTAGKVVDNGLDVGKDAGKLASGIGDLAKSPVGKIAGKAALPLGLVGGAFAVGQDAGTFKDAITDPFDSEKRGEAVKALREDSPIPGTPLVLDAITDPGKLADTAKDVGKVFTDPGVDSLKNAGKSIGDELGLW